MVHTIGKDFFATATFKLSFQTVKKFVVCFGLYESSLYFYVREDQIFMGGKFSFLYVVI